VCRRVRFRRDSRSCNSVGEVINPSVPVFTSLQEQRNTTFHEAVQEETGAVTVAVAFTVRKQACVNLTYVDGAKTEG